VNLLWDPLFLEPLLTGLVLAPLVAVLGCWLRLRGEWLAALGYSHVAGAGGVLGAALHWPMLPVAMALALVAGAARALTGRSGNEGHAVMILLGWCTALLLAANLPRAEVSGRVFIDGHIFFSGPWHLFGALVLVVLAVLVLPCVSPRLLRDRLQPAHYAANGRAVRPFILAFDGLTVLVLATATLAMGVMAAFALVLVPAWVAWQLATGWRAVLLLSGALGFAAQGTAFLLALGLDQPFGPVLVVCLLCLLPLRRWRRRL
jgi:zinc/manganese transport system permease protein